MPSSEHDSSSTEEVGAGEAWLGWRRVDEAATAFLDAANAAAEILEDLEVAGPTVELLREEAIPYAEEIRDQLAECEESLQDAVELIESFKDEVEASDFEELLSSLDDAADDVLDLIGERASDEIAEDISQFVAAKLQPVQKAGWHLYHALNQAA